MNFILQKYIHQGHKYVHMASLRKTVGNSLTNSHLDFVDNSSNFFRKLADILGFIDKHNSNYKIVRD